MDSENTLEFTPEEQTAAECADKIIEEAVHIVNSQELNPSETVEVEEENGSEMNQIKQEAEVTNNEEKEKEILIDVDQELSGPVDDVPADKECTIPDDNDALLLNLSDEIPHEENENHISEIYENESEVNEINDNETNDIIVEDNMNIDNIVQQDDGEVKSHRPEADLSFTASEMDAEDKIDEQTEVSQPKVSPTEEKKTEPSQPEQPPSDEEQISELADELYDQDGSNITVEKDWHYDIRGMAENYDSEDSKQIKKIFNRIQVMEDICRACNKRVYPMEKLIADKGAYHKTCFKCEKCKRTLSLGNFAVNNSALYCKPHFIEMFKIRGHYDDKRLVIPAGNVKGISEENGTSTSKTNVTPPSDIPRGVVARGDDTASSAAADDLPPGCYTKSVLAKFKEMENGSSDKKQENSISSERDCLPAPQTAKSLAAAFTAMGSQDATKSNEPASRPPPAKRIDDFRQADDREIPQRDESACGQDEMPEQGTTKNLLKKFQQLQTAT